MEALQPALVPDGRPMELVRLPEFTPVKPRRICLLGYRSHPFSGGQGVYLHYLSKALVELGHRVDVISGQPYPHLDPRVRLIKMPGMNLYEHGLRSLRPRHLGSRADMLEWISKLCGGFAEPQAFGIRVADYLRKRRQDYDIVHDNQSLSYGMLTLQRLGIPLVTTIHHPITSDLRLALAAAKNWWHRLLVHRWHGFLLMQQRVAGRLNHIITVSRRSREDISQDFGLASGRITVVSNGVDTGVFMPQPQIRRQAMRLMTTASADQPLKGLRYLLEAMHELRDRYEGLELLVVGKLRQGGAAARLLERLQLQDRVHFVSGISTTELVQEYARATMVIAPSLYEGFGLPVAEAMACGVPVISSDGGALPEVVGAAAVTVPAGDKDALAQAIAALLDDVAERDRLGLKGRERMLKEFCWRRTARQMTNYYESVLTTHADG